MGLMKRWIIRSFFIGLLLLCVGGWVGSYKYASNITYEGWRRHASGYFDARSIWGKLHVDYAAHVFAGGFEDKDYWQISEGLRFHSYPAYLPDEVFTYGSGIHHFVGFGLRLGVIADPKVW